MRPIDADAIVMPFFESSNDETWMRVALDSAPTIEPKQERCEYCKDGDFMGQRQMLGNDGKWHKIFFCPNCGAKMGEREGE